MSKIIKEKIKLENPLIFDVGCNEGEFIDFSLNLFKNPTIYSFEPETTSYQKLLEKYGKNNAINLYNFALGNKKEEARIEVTKNGTTAIISIGLILIKKLENKEELIQTLL